MADFPVLGGERALAVIDDADVSVACAALRDSIQSPISNLFHTHNKPSMILAARLPRN
jgi:hypothetical protein